MALSRFAAIAATSLRLRCAPSIHSGFLFPVARLMSTNVLEHLKYSPSHEWVKVDGDVVYVGITDHAQDALGEVVHVDVKSSINEKVTKGDVFAVVESVKAATDVYTPVSGTIVEINDTLDGGKNPEKVNKSPYDDGWFAKIKLTDKAELDTLLGAKAYEDHVAASDH